MRYQGGKHRQAKKFAPVLIEALRASGGAFIEPFVGGFNLVPHLGGEFDCYCSDSHRGLINLWQALQAGKFDPPTTVSRELHAELKTKRGTDPLSVFVSFVCSFGGAEWTGFATGKINGKQYDFVRGGRESCLRKAKHMERVRFSCCDYQRIGASPGDVVYADPPYEGTAGYRAQSFQRSEFEAWCQQQKQAGARVFASEYQIAPGWEPVVTLHLPAVINNIHRPYEKRAEYLLELK